MEVIMLQAHTRTTPKYQALSGPAFIPPAQEVFEDGIKLADIVNEVFGYPIDLHAFADIVRAADRVLVDRGGTYCLASLTQDEITAILGESNGPDEYDRFEDSEDNGDRENPQHTDCEPDYHLYPNFRP